MTVFWLPPRSGPGEPGPAQGFCSLWFLKKNPHSKDVVEIHTPVSKSQYNDNNYNINNSPKREFLNGKLSQLLAGVDYLMNVQRLYETPNSSEPNVQSPERIYGTRPNHYSFSPCWRQSADLI